MQQPNRWQLLASHQAPSGAFKSTICSTAQHRTDWNGFITAQVIRTLSTLPPSQQPQAAIHAGLAFLRQCESTAYPGTFGFWPSQYHQAIARLPEDADDTAVIALELARWGYLSRSDLVNIACKVLVPNRLVRAKEPHPDWIRPGVFLTWLRQDARANVIDCCANANVVALLSYAELQHLPGYDAACQMIEAGIIWAGRSLVKARSLSPFYPHPIELFYAVSHAVDCGAQQLATSLQLLHQLNWLNLASPQVLNLQRPICSSAYGHTVWRSEALQIVRSMKSE